MGRQLSMRLCPGLAEFGAGCDPRSLWLVVLPGFCSWVVPGTCACGHQVVAMCPKRAERAKQINGCAHRNRERSADNQTIARQIRQAIYCESPHTTAIHIIFSYGLI